MFPEYKLHGFLFRTLRHEGWEDRGEVGELVLLDNRWRRIDVERHSFCKRDLHIGREGNGEIFKFCPTCLVKVEILQKQD